MSHHESGDRLASQILLPLTISLDEGPFGRSGDQDSATGQDRPNCPHAFGRRAPAKPCCFLRRNLGSARKMKVAKIHGNTKRG